MSKVKTARQDWEDRYIEAILKFEPRLAGDDAWEEAMDRYETNSHEDPVAVARRDAHVDGPPHVEYILGVNMPEWVTPETEMPPGWRCEGGRWRND